MDKMAKEETNEELASNVRLLEAEERSRQDLDSLTDDVKMMEIMNENIRSSSAAYKLYMSQRQRNLKKILERGKGNAKRLANVEKQYSVLRSRLEEEKKRLMKAVQELLEREKEVEEAEVVCFSCEKNVKSVGNYCPYCHIGIEQGHMLSK